MSRYRTSMAGTGPISRAFYRVARLIVAGSTRVYTRMEIDGRERLPAVGGYVLAPVHRSYIDTPISACVTTRRLRFMGKDSMWKYAWFGRVLSALGAFPVSRGTADREALSRCIDVLAGGEPLVLYPEGERKDGPVVQPLYDGATFVAAKAGVPIVPLGIGGSAAVMPRGAKFVFPRKVHVIVGEPITVEVDERGRASRAAIKQASDHLHGELQRLFDEATARVG